MATRHWVTGGGTVAWPASATATNVDLTIPADATLLRFQLRDISVGGRGTSLDNAHISPMFMSQKVSFTSGFYSGRSLYTAFKAVDWQITVFLATAITTYNSFYLAGDNELGINQRCSYGGVGKPVSNLRFTWSPFDVNGVYNYVMAMNYQFAALYELP